MRGERCSVSFSRCPPVILRFTLEDGSSLAPQAPVEAAPDPEAVLHPLYLKQQSRNQLLDWKRTRNGPFAGEWEQILAWMRANPEVTSAEIFRALQRRYLGRYRPTQLRTLQRGMRLIRARLPEMEEASWPSEALPAADVPADPLLPRREEQCKPSSGTLLTAALGPPLAQESREAASAPGSLPLEQEAFRALRSVTGPEEGRVIGERKKRRRMPHVSRSPSPPSAFVAPMTVEHAISLYLQDLVARKRSPKTVEWHHTALGFLQEYF